MTRRMDGPAPLPRPQGEGVLEGFGLLKTRLAEVTADAVAKRLRAGHSPERIRAEVPDAAARMAKKQFPSADRFEESVFAFVQGLVEAELAKHGVKD